MKYLLIVFIALTTISEGFAQTIGFKGGVNFSNMVKTYNSQTYSRNYKVNPGFNAGLIYDYSLNDNFKIEYGLQLSSCGFRIESIGLSENVNNLYILMPYTGKYYFGKGTTKFYLLLGPYAGIGILGKAKISYIPAGSLVSDEKNIKWGDDYYRFDFGVSSGAGFRYNSFEIGIGYNFGLIDISPDQINSYNVVEKNRVLTISVAYMLNKVKTFGRFAY
jgi:hypothetical protein